ncbi:hypothetical protein [Microcoleus sp. herbarium14]|uniref:hypothetical protein n=1 Tax=Microcoleus sp. herbarium14 TaxID=3055439 RepID=UPI002FCEB8A9
MLNSNYEWDLNISISAEFESEFIKKLQISFHNYPPSSKQEGIQRAKAIAEEMGMKASMRQV